MKLRGIPVFEMPLEILGTLPAPRLLSYSWETLLVDRNTLRFGNRLAECSQSPLRLTCVATEDELRFPFLI